jgi:hypothetical protein
MQTSASSCMVVLAVYPKFVSDRAARSVRCCWWFRLPLLQQADGRDLAAPVFCSLLSLHEAG